jgi:CheY-like chemotaxis protein
MSPEEKVNLLLVDDQPTNLALLEAILESPQYHLVKASSGREALKHLLNEDFAVILLDVMMPELDGFETAKLIKKRDQSKQIPIIFITAMEPDDGAMLNGYAVGATDYLFKPIDTEALRTKVAAFVDLYKKNRLLQPERRMPPAE